MYSFTWIEVVFGQFYMAVVVAQLVGLKLAEALPKRHARGEVERLAHVVEDHARGPLAIGGIDVPIPDVEGLEDVAVRVDDLVRARHE